MNRSKIIPVFFLCLAAACCYGQVPKTADSLKVYLATKPRDTNYVQAINEYAFLMVQASKFDEAQKEIAKMDALSRKLNYKSGFYKVVNMRGVVEYSKQQPEKAMAYFIEASKIIEKYKLPKKIYQTSLNNIMIIYSDMGDRDKATEYAMKLIDFQEKNKLIPYRGAPYAQIAGNLKFFKKYQEALPYYIKSRDVEMSNDNMVGVAIAENGIGNLYDDLLQTAEAAKHFKLGLSYAEKANYKLLQTDLLINLARMQRRLKQYREAESNLLKSEQILIEIESVTPLKTLYQGLGDLYDDQNRKADAQKYYLKSLAQAELNQLPEELYTINQTLADFSWKTGNYREAYKYLEVAQNYKDSIFKIETAKNTEDLLRKYEAGKRDQKISALAAQNKISRLEVKNASRQRIFLWSGLLFVIITAGLILRQSRSRKKHNEKLQLLNGELDEANKTKARFLGILNHDLKSPVSSLISFLHIQKENPEALDEKTRIEMQDKTISSAENLLESMEDILLWSKGQMDHFRPQPKPLQMEWLFDDLKKHFSHLEGINLVFENPENTMLTTDENYLKTILRNLIANSAKVLKGQPGAQVVVSAKGTQLSVSDNGPGIEKEQLQALYDQASVSGIQSGLGLNLVRDLAKAIDCRIAVDSKSAAGTTFTLDFV